MLLTESNNDGTDSLGDYVSLGSETFEEEEVILRELWMSDNADYEISGDEVTFWVEKIANELPYASGALRLKLFASEEPYFENESYDYVLSTYEIGKLSASGSLSDLKVTAKLNSVPAGSYFITIALTEDYWIVDYVSSGRYEVTPPDDCFTCGDAGYFVTPDLWIKADINTEEKGIVEAVWQEGGRDETADGNKVIWGYFYASPDDVFWGSKENPEVFVKIWFDANGRIDVSYFHVSVPDIDVYADYRENLLESVTTLNRRYVRLYYNQNSRDGVEVNYEDGIPAAGYSPPQNPPAYSVINGLEISAVINTANGPIDAVWKKGGDALIAGGHQVLWGHFYADPSDVSWGSKNNPDLFVKVWFDAGGRTDVNFFHVSVPDIEVYSDYPGDGFYDEKGTTIMADRYIRHEY